MANLKIFISSTCYDLGVVRAQLRNFIQRMGYEPVMSFFNIDDIWGKERHNVIGWWNKFD